MNAQFTTAIVMAGLSLTIGSSCASAQTRDHRPPSFDNDRELKYHKPAGNFYSSRTVEYSGTRTSVTVTIISSGGPILQIGRDCDDRRGHNSYMSPMPYRQPGLCPMIVRDERIPSPSMHHSGQFDRRIPRFPRMPEPNHRHR